MERPWQAAPCGGAPDVHSSPCGRRGSVGCAAHSGPGSPSGSESGPGCCPLLR